MTPQNQGFSSNKTLPEMTRPKNDPVISRFQDFVVLGAKIVELWICLLLTGQSKKVDWLFQMAEIHKRVKTWCFPCWLPLKNHLERA